MVERGREKIGAAAATASLAGWVATQGRDAIAKGYRFADFSAAFGFMTRAAMAAEAMDHHPEWTNVYNRVDVTLTTHSAGGVTALDVSLARTLDRLAEACGAR